MFCGNYQERIDHLDLSWIEEKLVMRRGYTEDEAKRALFLYRCVLKIAAIHPDRPVTPPSCADAAFHLHILNTRKYFHDCRWIFGQYVHHNPDAIDTPEFWEGWKFTQEKLQTYFDIDIEGDDLFSPRELMPDGCYLLPRSMGTLNEGCEAW